MKIAQVAPLYESVPPHRYGGTERVVSYLTEELVRLGEDVTLFASGDSKTAAHLIPISPRSLRLGKAVDTLAHHIVLLEEVFSDSINSTSFISISIIFTSRSRVALPLRT